LTPSAATRFILPRVVSLYEVTPRYVLYPYSPSINQLIIRQIFRFATSKNESLFLQRKNPRKIAWTQVFRRMHKKGITEEVAKKRSRKTVKHQRGIVGVGADLQSILAKRNQTEMMRAAARQQAIAKAKEGKKAKEATKVKSKASRLFFYKGCTSIVAQIKLTLL
jgi:large subunit ribosomal protein L24e